MSKSENAVTLVLEVENPPVVARSGFGGNRGVSDITRQIVDFAAANEGEWVKAAEYKKAQSASAAGGRFKRIHKLEYTTRGTALYVRKPVEE